jgi:hypothetical protein
VQERTDRADREAEAERLEAEMAEMCGILNAATGRLVGLIAAVLQTESWQGWGVRSAEQWVSWKCGVSPGRARSLVRMARRASELPETHAALVKGELSEDQVAVIARHAPADVDAQAAELGRESTVTQLRRVLGKYTFTEPRTEPVGEEERRVSFSSTEQGWRLSALLPADEGAVWEKALRETRDDLFRSGEAGPGPGAAPADVDWADAFMAIVEKSLGATAVEHPHRDRHLVLLHLPVGADGHLHLGRGLSEGLARYVSCDSRVRAVFETGGTPVSVGRAFRIVPDRTRMVVENRDGGCRVPGCDRSRWVQVHHIVHWEDGGPTDTTNLLCLCSHHHRLHHRGGLGIEGDADEPDGVVFTDAYGRRLRTRGYPMLPTKSPPRGNWQPPPGESIDPWPIYFDERVPA